MERIIFKSPVTSTLNQVKMGFNLELFKALKPPIIQIEVQRFDGCEKGDEVHIKVGLLFMVTWISHITDHLENDNEWSFLDEGHQMPFPLKGWRHHHRVLNENGQTVVIDDISFTCGNGFFDKLLRPFIYAQFVGRKSVYQKIFGRP